MTQVYLGESLIDLSGELPKVGSIAPNFLLAKGKNLENHTLENFKGKKIILNIFPSLNTPVCSATTQKFNKLANDMDNTVVLCISRDLAWHQEEFCLNNNLKHVIFLSDMRSEEFGTSYGIIHTNGKFQGLLARSVVVIDENEKIVYTELVPQTGHEPDYDKVVKVLI